MNIIFDIDDTITKETEFMMKYAPKYLKSKYNLDFKVINPNGYDVAEVFGVEKILKDNNYPGNIEEEVKKINSSFWNKYFLKYMFYPLKPDTKRIIDNLINKGYKINFVSLRGKKTYETENIKQKFVRKKIVPFLTKMQLKFNGIKYNKLFLVETNEHKNKLAKELNAEMIFDDNIDVLENSNNIIPICVETPHNKLVEFKNEKVIKIPFTFSEINDLLENCGKKIKTNKIKRIKFYEKAFTENTYVLLRTFSKKKIISKLKPLVIGQENIPSMKGPNIYVSNHRNIKDPIITIAFLKNPTHFAALKRMFDNNENMFGKVGKNIGTYATTIFVKSMGCLPIARPTDENYRTINISTFAKIKEYLSMDSSVAIYPEGTINRKPDENGNILPLKSDQIFKLSKDGNAIIRPVAIIWVPKEAKIENRVLIAFLKPIYTKGLTTEEISYLWKNSVDKAIDAMNKIMEELIKISNLNAKQEDSQEIKQLIKKINE